MRLVLAAAALLLPVLPASAAVLTDVSIYTVGNYTAFGGARVAERIAVGGNMTNQSDTVGYNLTSADIGKPTVIVGGNLNYNYTTIAFGDVVYGGQDNSEPFLPNRVQTTNGDTVQGMPINFAQRSAGVISTASTLAAATPTGTFREFNNNSVGLLEGATAGRTVFTLSAADFASVQSFELFGTTDPTSQVVINIAGVTIDTSFTLNLRNLITADRVLINFHEATTLNLNGVQLPATVLAPNAAVTFNGGRIGGGLVAGSIGANSGDVQGVGDFLLSPGTAAVPEPTTWALLIAGFGFIGFMLRRPRALLWAGA